MRVTCKLRAGETACPTKTQYLLKQASGQQVNPERWGRRFRLPAVLAILLLSAIQAQQFTPHIGYVYPAGGRQGTTVQITSISVLWLVRDGTGLARALNRTIT